MSLDFLKAEISSKRKQTEELTGPQKKYIRRGELERLKEEQERKDREEKERKEREEQAAAEEKAKEKLKAKVCISIPLF
jgi:pre-mRNA-splicing factor 18